MKLFTCMKMQMLPTGRNSTVKFLSWTVINFPSEYNWMAAYKLQVWEKDSKVIHIFKNNLKQCEMDEYWGE